ncbi:hypothetical protein Bbelb_307380 [Branchiostoma belcheri]|nr:hypothetical protein Bbelb_307380 [Branchiostoma belcheri]
MKGRSRTFDSPVYIKPKLLNTEPWEGTLELIHGTYYPLSDQEVIVQGLATSATGPADVITSWDRGDKMGDNSVGHVKEHGQWCETTATANMSNWPPANVCIRQLVTFTAGINVNVTSVTTPHTYPLPTALQAIAFRVRVSRLFLLRSLEIFPGKEQPLPASYRLEKASDTTRRKPGTRTPNPRVVQRGTAVHLVWFPPGRMNGVRRHKTVTSRMCRGL